MRLFDLDSFEAERETWLAFLETLAPASFWQPFFSPDGYWDSRSRQEEVDASLRERFDFGIDQVRSAATDFFRRAYTHVRFYHGTRIHDEESFRRSGLLRSSIDAQNAIAFRMLGDSELLRAAIAECRAEKYACYNEGKVGVWYSRTSLIARGSYCHKGSEYLSIVSGKMGAKCHHKITSAGKRAVIACTLPVEMVDTWCESLSAIAVKRLFQVIDPLAPPDFFLDEHAVMLTYDIPPDWIEIEFLPEIETSSL